MAKKISRNLINRQLSPHACMHHAGQTITVEVELLRKLAHQVDGFVLDPLKTFSLRHLARRRRGRPEAEITPQCSRMYLGIEIEAWLWPKQPGSVI
jgi:hypothetical protein